MNLGAPVTFHLNKVKPIVAESVRIDAEDLF